MMYFDHIHLDQPQTPSLLRYSLITVSQDPFIILLPQPRAASGPALYHYSQVAESINPCALLSYFLCAEHTSILHQAVLIQIQFSLLYSVFHSLLEGHLFPEAIYNSPLVEPSPLCFSIPYTSLFGIIIISYYLDLFH